MIHRLIFLATFLIGCVSALTSARAGHESSFYPSFYPQEIKIEVVDAASAATRLKDNSLHAYIGPSPFSPPTTPSNVSAAEFLGSYLVVTFNPASEMAKSPEGRCAAARGILAALAREDPRFVFHPHPVTPYHPDYLHHFDVLQSVKAEISGAPAPAHGSTGTQPKLGAAGQLAESLVRSHWRVEKNGWDATVEEVDVASLMARRAVSLNGWLGPPWLKEGWFHAYLLLAETMSAPAERQRADALYHRLVSGAYDGVAGRVSSERALVSLLTRGCERVVVGYTVKRAYYNSDFSAGVENIAQDSISGFVSPVFIRTIKLKDFPWNGWLTLGVHPEPAVAWNPVAGFTDPAGKLIWSAVGDPAFLPAPSDGSWLPNRVVPTTTARGSGAGGIEVPRDALVPEPGTGLLRTVGPGKTATSKITYRVRMSAFHDGTRMTTADVLYPFVFAFRWGVRSPQDARAFDPSVEGATELMRKTLAGLRVVRIEQEVKSLADVQLVWQIPVIEVYLNSASADVQRLAQIAPPWSTLPWHLLVLMEEGVKRGVAAFSQEEAKRRGVKSLDLVRDRQVHARLASLTDEFERVGYLPDALKGLATVEEARQRWAALKQFAQAHGHFLVTNGPYRLAKWSGDGLVLDVFRDFSYPLGVGSFDQYALPPRASISKVEMRPGGLRVSAEMEKAERVQRTYANVRELLTKSSTVRGFEVQAVCRYVVVDSAGQVARAGEVPIGADGGFTVDFKELKPGTYRVLTAIYLNGNSVNPDVRLVEYRVEQ